MPIFLRVHCPYSCLTHAGSPEGERMDLFDKGSKGVSVCVGWGVALQPPSIPCAWAHSVMKWPVMEVLSKQWAYSTWRGVSVRTGPNMIPLFHGCSASFLSITLFFTLSSVANTMLPFCLHLILLIFVNFVCGNKGCKQSCNTILLCVFKRYNLSFFTYWFYQLLYYL